jgi:hypothetical protein
MNKKAEFTAAYQYMGRHHVTRERWTLGCHVTREEVLGCHRTREMLTLGCHMTREVLTLGCHMTRENLTTL